MKFLQCHCDEEVDIWKIGHCGKGHFTCDIMFTKIDKFQLKLDHKR